MKNKLVRVILVCSSLVILNTTNIIAAQNISDFTFKTTSTLLPKAESTGYKYMEINGFMYKRLWSYTRNCWVDDRWYPCS